MKVLYLVVFLALTLSAVASPIEVNTTRINGENGWYIPQRHGPFKWLPMHEFETLRLKDTKASAPVSFYLYTRARPNSPIEFTKSTSSINNAGFNSKWPTIFIIHGWVQSYNEDMYKQVRDAFFLHGDYNAIAVDWSRARGEYLTAVAAVPETGKNVAEMIDYIAANYYKSSPKMEVIGHSLGAQVAGYTGKNVKNYQIHRIVGLDAAKPGFSYEEPSKRLSEKDAFYVETIHTNGACYGFMDPIGTKSFYANGGKTQPGCVEPMCAGFCSHQLSVFYFVEAVRTKRFASMQCTSVENAIKKSCGNSFSNIQMGAASNAYQGKGVYYVPVNKNPPYSH